MNPLFRCLTSAGAIFLAGCVSTHQGEPVRRFSRSSDLQSHGREFCGQKVSVVGRLGYQKGGRDLRVDIGGDVLLRVPEELAPRIELLVGQKVSVSGVLLCPRDRSTTLEIANQGDQPVYAQGYQSDYLLFTVDVSDVDQRK